MVPPLGTLYDIDGRHLMLHHTGKGTPVVVIEAGAGNFGLDYLHVQRGVSRFATCAVYDRAGYGWSDADPQPRTAAEPLPISAELARSLLAAKLELHAALAAGVSHGEHRVLPDAGHMVQYEQPDAITDAVRDVLDRIANG
jgi:pimeloyl-ACP methyl ester carboxylesterase